MNRDLGLTLAGGGNRAFYQWGLLGVWKSELLPRIATVASCSAGACMITIHLSERGDETLAFWKKRRSHMTRNFDWGRLLRGKRPMPHASVYRDTLMFAYADGGFERIRRQPFPIYILCSRLPRFLDRVSAALLGMTIYSIEKKLRPDMIHPTQTRKLGFSPLIFDARACRTPEELADLVLASSATPPFTPVGRFRGNPLLDGGLIDNVPAFVAETEPDVKQNLILLTRPYPANVTGIRENRLYLAPSRPVPADRWDYTRPHLVEATIKQGRQETTLHRPLLDTFLGPGI